MIKLDGKGAKAAREALHAMGRDLAMIMDLTPSHLSRIESGWGGSKVPRSLDILLKLFERDVSAYHFALDRARSIEAEESKIPVARKTRGRPRKKLA